MNKTDKKRKLTDEIFKFSNKDVYRCAMLNLNECLSKNECIREKCERYSFCAGNNLSHINLYVKKLETTLNEIREHIDNMKCEFELNSYVTDFVIKLDNELQIIDKVLGEEK